MQLSAQGLALIEQFEGFSATPYRCPAGWWTIGYGHVIRPSECATLLSLDESSARLLLMQDVTLSEHAIGRLITVALRQQQFDALVSFTFNLGAGTLQRSTLRRVLNRGEYATVPAQLMRFVWAGGHKILGLVRRRAAEAALYQA